MEPVLLKHPDFNPRELARSLRRYMQDIKYFEGNIRKISQDNPDMYVAIQNRKVIGSDKYIETLTRKLRNQGIDTGWVYIARTYFKEKPVPWILDSTAV